MEKGNSRAVSGRCSEAGDYWRVASGKWRVASETEMGCGSTRKVTNEANHLLLLLDHGIRLNVNTFGFMDNKRTQFRGGKGAADGSRRACEKPHFR